MTTRHHADLTQEIFARFIQGDWPTRARNPHAYLFGIASNVVADARAAERRDVVTYDSEISNSAGETLTAGGSGDADNLELQDELTRALEQLPESHRVALLLTKRDGLSGKEAAARMGIGEASFRVYVCEARAKLRTLLKQGKELSSVDNFKRRLARPPPGAAPRATPSGRCRWRPSSQ